MSTELTITIDPEFQSLIPPLAEDERKQLESSLCFEGCRDPLVTWNGILLDGHNRKEICDRYKIPYSTIERTFLGRDSARIWVIQNQLGRRNLTDYERGVLALKLKPMFAEMAKAQQGLRTDILQNSAKCSPIDTRAALAKAAGVSHDTIHKVEVIEREAPPAIKEAVRKNEISIHAGYQQVRPPAPKPAPLAPPSMPTNGHAPAPAPIPPLAPAPAKPKANPLIYCIDNIFVSMGTIKRDATPEAMGWGGFSPLLQGLAPKELHTLHFQMLRIVETFQGWIQEVEDMTNAKD